MIVLLIVLLLICAAGYFYERIGERRGARRNPAPGRMVSVGDHRLHILMKGSGGPTVVIEQGAGEPSRLWWPLQNRIAEFAAVCTYDRAGYAWSDPVAKGRTVEDRTVELHTLLNEASIPAPYILVAHSYGGLIVRLFAQKYPAECAGLVLVDTPEEGCIFRKDVLDFYAKVGMMQKAVIIAARLGLLRLLSHWISLHAIGFPFVRPEEYRTTVDDLASLKAEPRPRFGSLGNLPLVVISHGQPFPGPFAVLEKGWIEGQQRLVALSTRGRLVVAAKSNHMIHIDEPDLILDAIRQVQAGPL